MDQGQTSYYMVCMYSINDDIPVAISNGRFHVDFSEIYQELVRYFPELVTDEA